MPGWRALLIVAFLLAPVSPPARAVESPNFAAWFVDSLVKVFPSDSTGTHRLASPEYLAARNQHVSLELAIRSRLPLANLTAEAAPLEATGGQKISSLEIHPLGYVVAGSHTPDSPPEELVGEAPGWYPDPLLDFPLGLEPHRTYPLWVTLHVPGDAAPGVYRGVITVRSGERVLTRAAFRLRVVAAAVAEARSLKVTNWFGFDDKISRQFYGVPEFSDAWWTLIENAGRVMAEHRQNVVLTPLLDLIKPRNQSDVLRYDFSNFDRWVETFQKSGAIGFIEGSHLVDRAGSYDAPLLVHTFQVVEGGVQKVALPPDDPRVESFLTGFLRALSAHLDARGWKQIYFQHILDEAHGAELPYYARFAALAHRELPGVATLDAVDAAHMPEELKTGCDVWVPQLGRFDDQMEMLRARMEHRHEVWFYTCLYPQKRYLNRLLDFPLLKVRLLHWLNFRYGFTGFLHWGGNFWTPDPMRDTQPVIDDNTELLPPGDAFILYPDRPHLTVRSSIRLEAMREGLEDYELLRALASRNPAEAQRIAASAVSSFTEYVRDPQAFRRIEQRLLEALSKP